jgi:hypothetical protein
MKFGLGIALAGLLGLAPTAFAGDNDWESPVVCFSCRFCLRLLIATQYNYFYKFPLPIPPVAERKQYVLSTLN